MKFEVFMDTKKNVLILVDKDATMEVKIPCTDLEALDLMWKIHTVMGGNGTLTRN